MAAKRPSPFFFCIISIILGIFCSQTIGAETVSSPIQTNMGISSLVGPKTGEVGQPITFLVQGLPEILKDKTIEEQTKWFESKSILFVVSKPEGSVVELKEDLSLKVLPTYFWELKLSMVPDKIGTYVVICHWNLEPRGLAHHRIEIRGPPAPPVPPTPPPTPPVPPTPPTPPTPTPTPTPTPIPTPTTGLHVIIVDNENVRGTLPQSQVNIFSSKEVADWLKKNTAKTSDGQPAFRFSSNDSLVGEEARKLELPIFVEGWDTLMKAVSEGKVQLPAWAISNGSRGVIEPLPTSIEATIRRLEEYK